MVELDKTGFFDSTDSKTFDLSMINGKITRDTVQISKDAKKAASDDFGTAKLKADGSIDIDRAMDDYFCSQGGYLEDAGRIRKVSLTIR